MIVCPESFIRGQWTQSKSSEGWRRAVQFVDMILARRGASACLMLVGLPGSGKTTWAEAHDSARTLIYDSTALTRSARRSILRLCNKHRVPCDAVIFRTPVDECIARQGRRTKVVPASMIRTMAVEYQPPSTEEGFRRVLLP